MLYVLDDKRFSEDVANGQISVRSHVNSDLPVLTNLDIIVNDEMSSRMFGEKIFSNVVYRVKNI